MLRRRFLTLTVAIATMAMAAFGGSNRAFAAIELTVTTGATTDVFYASSSTFFATGPFSLAGYLTQVQTTLTDYPGTPSIGSISTTVNISSTNAALGLLPLTTTVEVIQAVAGVADGLVTNAAQLAAVEASPLITWNAPSTPTVLVSADASASVNRSVTSGSVQTTTYYDTPGVLVGPGTPVVMSGVLTLPPPQPAVFMEVAQPNLGTYTLSQSVTLTGINNGATNFNYTANSGVTPTPEPSSMAIAGLGALGLIGYGLRRRRGA